MRRAFAYTLLAALAATAAFASDASARPWRRGYYGPRVARPWVAPRARFGYARPWVRRAAWRRGYAWRRPWVRPWGVAAVASPYYGWGYGYSYPSYYGYAAPSYDGAVYVSTGLRAYAYPTYVLSTVTYASSGAGCGYWAYGCGWSYSYPAYALPTRRPYYGYGSYGYANVGYGFGYRSYGCGTCAVSYSWRPCGCW
jgi:hypothetical protein